MYKISVNRRKGPAADIVSERLINVYQDCMEHGNEGKRMRLGTQGLYVICISDAMIFEYDDRGSLVLCGYVKIETL